MDAVTGAIVYPLCGVALSYLAILAFREWDASRTRRRADAIADPIVEAALALDLLAPDPAVGRDPLIIDLTERHPGLRYGD